MLSLARARLYWHTLRHLKTEQIFWRLARPLHRPRPDLSPPPPRREPTGIWHDPAPRAPSLVGPRRFRFLGVERDVDAASDWNAPDMERLWLYNLHYFDELSAPDDGRDAWRRRLLVRWMAENPPGVGPGWEPYPISLRAVNWIKWLLAGHEPPEGLLHSLAVQLRFLAGSLERHLLGNHLLANAKALAYGGFFFAGPEAQAWLEIGLGLLEGELAEQILPDGGHFELSPMYHSLILEDVLDLVNLAGLFPEAVPARRQAFVAALPALAGRMRTWLAGLTHPDGGIVLFNDAALDIAPPPAVLEDYADRLALPPVPRPRPGLTVFPASGYVRLESGPAVAFLDAARVGPDYLPGHAHADTLTFELSLGGRRLAVDSGVSCYGVSAERLRQRGTAAHNTVTVDDLDSSETWGGFRVARRAYPDRPEYEERDGVLRVACGHDGYRRLPGRPVHRRQWRLSADGFQISDELTGRWRRATARVRFAPGVVPVLDPNGAASLAWEGGQARIGWTGAAPRLTSSTYHPRFGQSLPCALLELELSGSAATFDLAWD